MSDVSLSDIDSDLESLDSVADSSVASFPDGTYTDVSFDLMQEFLDDDLSDSSDLEQYNLHSTYYKMPLQESVHPRHHQLVAMFTFLTMTKMMTRAK
jgi:hypothetical protein